MDPIARLARQLERSSAQILAIDSGHQVVPDASPRERRRRFQWLLGRGDEPRTDVDRETAERRERAEAAHGHLPFRAEADFDANLGHQQHQVAERETERMLRKDRGIGRGL